MAFYELRQYLVRPGKMDEWVKIMEEEIIPFQVSKGMVICGSFRGETDESALYLDPPLRQRGRARGAVQGGLRDRPLEDQDRAARPGVPGPREDGHPADRADTGRRCSSDVGMMVEL